MKRVSLYGGILRIKWLDMKETTLMQDHSIYDQLLNSHSDSLLSGLIETVEGEDLKARLLDHAGKKVGN